MKNSLIHGLSFLTASSLLFILSGYIINVVIARLLGPERYGSYGVVLSVWTIVNLILTSGLPQAVSKFVSAHDAHPDDILKSALKLQVILITISTTVYIVSTPLIAEILNDPSLIPYLKLSGLIIPFYSLYSLYIGYHNGLHNFFRQSLMGITYAIFKAIGVISLAYFFGLAGALLGFVISPIIAWVIGFKFPKTNVKHFAYKKLILFSLPLIGFTVFMTLLQSVGLYSVKILISDTKAAGFYTAIQNIAIIPFYLLGSISQIIFPSISKSTQDNDDVRSKRLVIKSFGLIVLVLIPACAMISLLGKTLIQILFSTQYLPAAPALSVLAWSYAGLTLFSYFSNTLNGAGYPYRSVVASIIGVLGAIVGCLVLIPRYGLIGAAISTGIGTFTSAGISGAIVYNKFIWKK
jgi:stage V sporulation protein B